MIKSTFLETYKIIYNIKKSDGYWLTHCEEIISVPIKHGIREKNNHIQAKTLFMEKYPLARIIAVIYC